MGLGAPRPARLGRWVRGYAQLCRTLHGPMLLCMGPTGEGSIHVRRRESCCNLCNHELSRQSSVYPIKRTSGLLCKAELSWLTCGEGSLSEGLIQRWWTAAALLPAAALASAMRILTPRCISSSPAECAQPWSELGCGQQCSSVGCSSFPHPPLAFGPAAHMSTQSADRGALQAHLPGCMCSGWQRFAG